LNTERIKRSNGGNAQKKIQLGDPESIINAIQHEIAKDEEKDKDGRGLQAFSGQNAFNCH